MLVIHCFMRIRCSSIIEQKVAFLFIYLRKLSLSFLHSILHIAPYIPTLSKVFRYFDKKFISTSSFPIFLYALPSAFSFFNSLIWFSFSKTSFFIPIISTASSLLFPYLYICINILFTVKHRNLFFIPYFNFYVYFAGCYPIYKI